MSLVSCHDLSKIHVTGADGGAGSGGLSGSNIPGLTGDGSVPADGPPSASQDAAGLDIASSAPDVAPSAPDAGGLRVLSTSPADGAMDAQLVGPITITFSAPLLMGAVTSAVHLHHGDDLEIPVTATSDGAVATVTLGQGLALRTTRTPNTTT
jgi:hypothetical protein